jgi:hypothetical protein
MSQQTKEPLLNKKGEDGTKVSKDEVKECYHTKADKEIERMSGKQKERTNSRTKDNYNL